MLIEDVKVQEAMPASDGSGRREALIGSLVKRGDAVVPRRPLLPIPPELPGHFPSASASTNSWIELKVTHN